MLRAIAEALIALAGLPGVAEKSGEIRSPST
jgi:hypothetical protein